MRKSYWFLGHRQTIIAGPADTEGRYDLVEGWFNIDLLLWGLFHLESAHDGKHLPNATSSFGDPLMRILLRSKAHKRLRSFARKPSHVSLSAVTRRSASP